MLLKLAWRNIGRGWRRSAVVLSAIAIGLSACLLVIAWMQGMMFQMAENAIRTQLIPKGVREWRASNMARRQFLERNLHHTDGDTGVLIFVSEAEHYVEILADRGISAQVDDGRWAEIIAASLLTFGLNP